MVGYVAYHTMPCHGRICSLVGRSEQCSVSLREATAWRRAMTPARFLPIIKFHQVACKVPDKRCKSFQSIKVPHKHKCKAKAVLLQQNKVGCHFQERRSAAEFFCDDTTEIPLNSTPKTPKPSSSKMRYELLQFWHFVHCYGRPV